MRLPAATCFYALLATLLCAAGGPAQFGQMKLDMISPHDPRRTPVVEVFHHWKDSVVYLTGPMATAPAHRWRSFSAFLPWTAA